VVINITIPVLGGRTLQAIASWMEAERAMSEALCGREWSGWVARVVGGAWTIDEVRSLVDAARQFLLGKRKAEIQALALEASAIVGPIYTVVDVRHDPQLAARGYWTETDGRTHPGAFAWLSRTSIEPSAPAPQLGEHQCLLSERGKSAARRSGAADGGNGERRQPFAGLKLADCSWLSVGPIIGKALGDYGATVVRIESESRPDPLRLLPPYTDGIAGINGSQFVAYLNTSKLGLALNLGTEEGKGVARRLID
jgi:crotonobetainyl-CoA:carnitine CoA-transferase CaiB-like acyl-CoA transferase